MPVGADAADEQLRLDGAGAVDDDHTAGVVGGDGRHGPGLGRGARPGAEGLGEGVVEVDAGEVADDHGGGRGGADVGLVEGAHGGGVDALDGLLGALAGAGHPELGREELGGQRHGRAAAGVGQLVRDLVQAVADQALDLVVREGRGAQGVGEQAEGLVQPGGRDLQREADAGVVGVGVEGGAAALQLGGEVLGAELVGALRERPRHDRGDAVQTLGLGGQRGVEDDLDGDDLLAGAVAAQHGQAVGQLPALGGREGPRGGQARLGLGVELHRGARDVHGARGYGVAHRSVSSSFVSAAASAASVPDWGVGS